MINKNLTILLALLILSIIISGCQNLPNQDDLATNELFVPDAKLDKEEAEFESLILTEAKTPKSKPLEPRTNLWDELADNFEFLANNKKEDYDYYLKYFLKNYKHLERTSVRANPYLYFITEEIKSRGMPADIALLPIVESAFYPYAHSRMRAAGLWQFIPSTGQIYGLKQDWWYDGRQDVYESTHAALDFLQNLYELNNQDWLLALASYNAGYGRILQATKKLRAKSPNAKVTYWSIRPYLPKETRHYVPQLLAVNYLIKNRESYDLNIEPIANEPYLVKVELGQQVDLAKAAKVLDISNDLIKHLNPGYLNKVTPPAGPHHLMIPLDKQDLLEAQLANNSDLFNISWQKHYVVNGDSLNRLAYRYKTSVKEIQSLNNIKGHVIRAGRTLLIPIPAGVVPSTQMAANTTTPSHGQATSLHKVKNGESLWVIANYYGVSTTQLTQWNNLNPKSHLRIGQELKIHSNKYGHTIKYRVQNGESLWLIAKRHNVSVSDLARWNNINTKKPIQPGTNLTIWRQGNVNSYTVKKGDTIWDIAKLFNINSNQLQKHNNLTNKQTIRPGQILKIPTVSSSL